VDYINELFKNEEDATYERKRELVIQAAKRRFRPILLTSITTFFGLLPMIFEESVQAQFLIPMAISLGFGIIFATIITLYLVPSGIMILEGIKEALSGSEKGGENV
jgi:multidrug efflux pump subunit AcrB